MKKLIMAAAALTAGIVLADDSIVSSTVVGYQTKKTTEYYSLQTASFGGTGGASTYSIQNIIPSAPEGKSIGGGVFDMQTLTDSGSADEVFYYLTVSKDRVPKDGWYDEDMETYATKTFEKGEAFMINNTIGADAGMTFSGEVLLSDITISLPEYYSIKGNLRAETISIQDIIPLASDGTSPGGGVFDMQTLTDSGSADEVFYYLTVSKDRVPKDGWYDEDMETYATKTFEAGAGFMLNNTTGAKGTLKYK